jgi:hypothetical protein
MTPPGATTAAAKTKPGRRAKLAEGRPRVVMAGGPKAGVSGSKTGAGGTSAGGTRPGARATRSGARGPRAGVGARPRAAARSRQRAAARPSLRRSPPRARRLSGPASRAIPELRPLPVLGTIGLGALRAGRSLHDSPLLDRLLRGRGWIGLLGVLLIGLVALNVSLLKLNSEAGRDADTAKTLRIRNDRLRARVARLASGERLEAVGARLGLAMPEPGRIRYLSVRSRDGRRAAKAIRSGWTGAAAAAPAPPAAAPPAAAPGTAPAATDPVESAPLAATPAPATPSPVTEAPPQQAPPGTAPGAAGQAPAAGAPAQG